MCIKEDYRGDPAFRIAMLLKSAFPAADFEPDAVRRFVRNNWRSLSSAAHRIHRRASADHMKRVILESPYAGDVERNVAYARAALRDSLRRGEAPIASHLLYTQPGVLDDSVPEERRLGIDAGLEWGEVAEATVVYEDLGISPGMEQGIARAEREGRPIERRTIGGWSAP
jgi:hypothetical protein